MKILFVNSDIEVLRKFKFNLKNYYLIDHAQTAEDAQHAAENCEYDLLLIGYTLTDLSGIDLCLKLKLNNIKTPLIMLSENIDSKTKINALNCGFDDYITIPFDFEEVHARIEAVLRRYLHTPTNSLSIADLKVDLDRKMATRQGKAITLQKKHMDILEYLMRNSGKVVTRSMILDHAWDSSSEILSNVVDVHIKGLRDRIDKNFDKKLIKTVHGYGYKIEE